MQNYLHTSVATSVTKRPTARHTHHDPHTDAPFAGQERLRERTKKKGNLLGHACTQDEAGRMGMGTAWHAASAVTCPVSSCPVKAVHQGGGLGPNLGSGSGSPYVGLCWSLCWSKWGQEQRINGGRSESGHRTEPELLHATHGPLTHA